MTPPDALRALILSSDLPGPGAAALAREAYRLGYAAGQRAATAGELRRPGGGRGVARFGATEAERRTLELARELRAAGRTLSEVASGLEDAGLRTRRGRPWSVASVGKLLQRSEEASGPR